MRIATMIATILALSAAPAVPQTQGDEDEDNSGAAVAALLLLGAAALAHHDDHHYDGKHSNDGDREHRFEIGFRDGLYGEPFDKHRHGQAYAEGYSAGVKERSNRLSHKTRGTSHQNAPHLHKRACIGEASARWKRNPRDIHVIETRKIGGNDYYVEVAAGHRHGVCEANREGRIFNFRKGRL